MSGILEVYLWLVIGKNIKNNSGNCHIVGTDQIEVTILIIISNRGDSNVHHSNCFMENAYLDE